MNHTSDHWWIEQWLLNNRSNLQTSAFSSLAQTNKMARNWPVLRALTCTSPDVSLTLLKFSVSNYKWVEPQDWLYSSLPIPFSTFPSYSPFIAIVITAQEKSGRMLPFQNHRILHREEDPSNLAPLSLTQTLVATPTNPHLLTFTMSFSIKFWCLNQPLY